MKLLEKIQDYFKHLAIISDDFPIFTHSHFNYIQLSSSIFSTNLSSKYVFIIQFKMNLQKQNQSGALIQKIQLLQSNSNRVMSQHEVLNRIISNPHVVQNFQDYILQIDEAVDRIERLKFKLARMNNNNERGINKAKWQSGEGRFDAQLKQAHLSLYKIREELSKLKQKQLQSSKNINRNISTKIHQIRQANYEEIETLKKNVSKFLNNTKKDASKNHQSRIIQFVQQNLCEEYEPYCQDMQADVGLLICELEYYNYQQNKDEIQKRIKEIDNIADRTKFKEKKQLELGKLEREILVKDSETFRNETQKRIIYDCQLLLKKIQLAIQCIKANSKNKHKRSAFCSKYQQQAKQFKKNIEHLECQYEGMKMKIRQSANKIKIINIKIQILSGQPMKSSQKFGQIAPEIQSNLTQCSSKFEEFAKLKSQYVYFS